MGQQHGWRLKRLGSLKIFIVLGGRAADGGEPAEAGSVVIYRRNAKRPNVYETVYDAWRSRLEIAGRYGADGRGTGELNELAETRERIQTAGLGLLDEDGGAAGGRVTRRIGRVARDLKRKSNPLKSEARLKAKAGPVRTAKNRKINRAATQARVTAIDSRLAEREEEVYSILPWIRAMETGLRLEIDRCLGVAGRLSRDVVAVLGHEFFRTGRTTPNQLKGIAARLRLLKNGPGSFEVTPFREAGRRLNTGLDQAIGCVESGDPRPAGGRLDQVLAVCDRLLLQRSVEELIAALSLLPAGPGAAALARLARLSGNLLDRCSDQPQARSFYDVALDLQAVRRGLDDHRRLCGGKQAVEAAAKLAEVKEILKTVSRRLSR